MVFYLPNQPPNRMEHPTAIEANIPTAETRELPDPRQFNTLGEAMDAARSDARKLASEAAPKLKQSLRTVAFDVAYGAAFGACFVAAFAREVAPEALKDGLARGARAGRDAAAKAKKILTVPATPHPEAPAACECPDPVPA